MKSLYKVSCTGGYYNRNTFSDIYVIADTYEEAADKALAKMKELKYDKVDEYVSSVELFADEKETTKRLLII